MKTVALMHQLEIVVLIVQCLHGGLIIKIWTEKELQLAAT